MKNKVKKELHEIILDTDLQVLDSESELEDIEEMIESGDITLDEAFTSL